MNKKVIIFFIALIGSKGMAQWDTTSNGNEVSTTDEIVGPVLRISNEIRVPNTFATNDPTIGTLDNTGYGINIHKTNGIGFTFNNAHNFIFQPDGDVVATGANPVLFVRGTGTGNYQGAALRLAAEGVTSGNNHQSTLFITHRGTDGTATIEMQRRGSANEYNGTPLFYKDGYGWRFQVANSTTSGMSSGLMIKQTGNIGMGTESPQTKLHVTTGTAGDAILKLEADTDNNNEYDNPGINLVQDGGLVKYFIEIEANANTKSTGTSSNALVIGTEASRDIQLISGDQVQMTIKTSGVGIGTTNPGSYKLAVKGKIRAEEIKVETGWADYVFKKDYYLPTLEEVENHIQEKGHLINIPSAKEVKENGIQLGEMNKLLLEKIEELTLYTLQQQKEIQKLGKLIEKQDELLLKLLKR